MEILKLILLCLAAILIMFFIILIIAALKRLHYLKTQNRTIEGDLYISSSGDIYSEFLIPIDEMVKRDTILLKVKPINIKKED